MRIPAKMTGPFMRARLELDFHLDRSRWSIFSSSKIFKFFESFARAIPGSAKQRIEKNMIFSILQNQMLITFDFGGASLCHEILHFVQKSQNTYGILFC